ncbi:alpha/beta fold hydrolase [Micromonospora aurantiaca]|uniref:alpha/beta fold hydrolase n=1 Tax=Micromonospora aurantiaca (nom. illeg.) TaxID=47850 RepID=UPI001F07B408|nr:alpha/beta fold hydrolase [Micromonospora aurantiaca]
MTYDPRGLGRSVRKDGRNDSLPEVQARDVRDIVDALGVGPVDMFASSGGAVTALALVAAYPDVVTTLVAHEPPLVTLLPRRRGGRTGHGRLPGGVPEERLGCRHGGVHRHDVVARRVHSRLLRPARARSRRVRNAGRGRRQARRPAALRPVRGGHRLPAGRRRAARRAHPGRGGGGRGVGGHPHRADVGGHRRAARRTGRGLPEPPRRVPRRGNGPRRAAGGVRAPAAGDPRRLTAASPRRGCPRRSGPAHVGDHRRVGPGRCAGPGLVGGDDVLHP